MPSKMEFIRKAVLQSDGVHSSEKEINDQTQNTRGEHKVIGVFTMNLFIRPFKLL